MKSWFKLLLQEGPKYRYYPEPSKSTLVVREELFDQAQLLFGDLGVTITSRSWFLGGFIGDSDGCEVFVKSKI